MTIESSVINVTGKTPEECQKIFAEYMELPGFVQFIKKTKGESVYYVFCTNDSSTVPLRKM